MLSTLAYLRSLTESEMPLSGDALSTAIQFGEPQFVDEHADNIATNYSLHNAWSFEDSGLQAALFREEGTDRYVHAITDAKFYGDRYNDLVVADFFGIDASASIGSVNQIIANASPVNFQSVGEALG